jgi:hypothetical protein
MQLVELDDERRSVSRPELADRRLMDCQSHGEFLAAVDEVS